MFPPFPFPAFQHAAPLVLAICFAGACMNADEGRACQRDEDCAELCSRVGECLSAESAIEIRLSWTISGQAPSPSQPDLCGRVNALELSFESDSPRDEAIIYYPVPCDLGRVYYDRMPDRVTLLRITAVDSSDAVLDVVFRNIESTASDFLVDFPL